MLVIGALVFVFLVCQLAVHLWLWWIVGSVLFWGGNVHMAMLAAVALCAQGLVWIGCRMARRK